jgi:4-amino-4-deoxy-L-arabinose transferase-like glycosyltransferase
MSAALMLGADILWRFSASGNSTMLLLLLFVLLVCALVKFDSVIADANATLGRVLAHAFLLGALLGLGMLTRYSYGVLAVPVGFYVIAFAGRWRFPALAMILIVFAALVVPWMARNMALCGMPFGTATYALIENSLFFPQHRLDRSLNPNFTQIPLLTLWWKLFTNLRHIVSHELPKLGGGWVMAFFVAGLMFSFRNPVLRRLRWFALGSLVMLILAQALGRTALSDDAPEVNTENLLVLLLPLVVIFGVSFFHTLMDQIPLPEEMIFPLIWIRRTIISVFIIVCTLPLTASFLPGRTTPLSYPPAIAFPPYYPPDIQKISNWMNEDELVMSDVPWAVAWYGHRQSAWLTLDAQGQFYTFYDYYKQVRALYLSPQFLDAKYFSDWVMDRHGEGTWGDLVILATADRRLPDGFPLVKSYRLNGQLFLSDWERWLKPEDQPKPK